MTSQERQAFLAEPRVGVLGVERPDRAPLMTPIWYDYSPGGEVIIWIGDTSVKYPLICEAGRFAITTHHDGRPYRYVTVEGPVTRTDRATPEDIRSMATRYGEPDVDVFVEQMWDSGSVIVGMRPERWLSMTEVRS